MVRIKDKEVKGMMVKGKSVKEIYHKGVCIYTNNKK